MSSDNPQGNPSGNPMRSLSQILDAVEDIARNEEHVSVGDVIGSLGRASTAALIFMPALVAATPLSGIPGLSAICGLIIALVAGQALIGRNGLWLPDFINRRTVEGEKLYNGLEKVRKPLAFLDRHTHKRLSFLTTGLGAKLLFAICMGGGLIMPLLEVIPFSASAVASGILLLSIAILTLDGVVVIVAGVVAGLIASLVLYLF